MLLNRGPQKVKLGSLTFQECGYSVLTVCLRLTGFDSLHLGTITRQQQTRLAPLLSPCEGEESWRGSERPSSSASWGCRQESWRRQAWGQLTECLQFQEQRAEDRIHFPPSGRPGWNAMWGRQFGMPTDHPAGHIGQGQGVAMCLCHGLISWAFFV